MELQSTEPIAIDAPDVVGVEGPREVPIEIVALSLHSVEPVIIESFFDVFFDVKVETTVNPDGSIDVQLPEGTVFDTIVPNQQTGAATNMDALDPDTGRVIHVRVGRYPYTYSDFTGFLRMHITAPEGSYRQLYDSKILEEPAVIESFFDALRSHFPQRLSIPHAGPFAGELFQEEGAERKLAVYESGGWMKIMDRRDVAGVVADGYLYYLDKQGDVSGEKRSSGSAAVRETMEMITEYYQYS